MLRLTVESLSKIFPTAVGLDQDLGNVGMMFDSDKEGSTTTEFCDYFASLHKRPGKKLIVCYSLLKCNRRIFIGVFC